MPKTPKPWFRNGRGWFVTIAGKQHNLGRNKKEAFERFYRLMSEPQETRSLSGRMLAVVIDDFLEFVQRNRAPDTYRWYRDLLQKFIACHATLKVDDIKPFHVQRWIDSYQHLAKTSRRNHIRAVKRCIRWAKSQGYINHNPLEDLTAPAAERKEVFISHEEYKEFLAFTKTQSLRDLFEVTWETGCRPQESLRVEARHVDHDNKRWVLPVSEAKGKRYTRTIYLTEQAYNITNRLALSYPKGQLCPTIPKSNARKIYHLAETFP